MEPDEAEVEPVGGFSAGSFPAVVVLESLLAAVAAAGGSSPGVFSSADRFPAVLPVPDSVAAAEGAWVEPEPSGFGRMIPVKGLKMRRRSTIAREAAIIMSTLTRESSKTLSFLLPFAETGLPQYMQRSW